MKKLSCILLYIFLSTSVYGQTFTIDIKGIVKCPNAKPGDKATLFGVTYEAVDNALLIQRRDQGADLTKVCTSLVTSLNGFFYGRSFNQPIGNWDVSNVTDMRQMFDYSTFNQPIGNWVVTKVSDMTAMFSRSPFNQNIEGWDVSNVTSMGVMFWGSAFNRTIGNWDVSKVTSMNAMFESSAFNQNISGWNVSNVVNMQSMFKNSMFNQNISQWCVVKITSEPIDFSKDSPLTTANKPVWGKCPGLPITSQLSAPSNNATNILFKPTFTWNAVTDASKYQLQVFEGTSVMVVDTLVSSTTVTLKKSLKSKTDHNWRVRGYNESKKLYGDWSSIWKFTTETIVVPSLQFPASGATMIGESVQLLWFNTPNTISYHLQISENTSFNKLFLDLPNLAGNTYKLDFVKGNPATLHWRVRSIIDSGEAGTWSTPFFFSRAPLLSNGDRGETPIHYSLDQNYPNPFNPTTNITFSLPTTTHVRLEVLTILGQTVSVQLDQTMSRGNHTITFDGSALSSGVYLYRLTTPEFTQTRVMNLVK